MPQTVKLNEEILKKTFNQMLEDDVVKSFYKEMVKIHETQIAKIIVHKDGTIEQILDKEAQKAIDHLKQGLNEYLKLYYPELFFLI